MTSSAYIKSFAPGIKQKYDGKKKIPIAMLAKIYKNNVYNDRDISEKKKNIEYLKSLGAKRVLGGISASTMTFVSFFENFSFDNEREYIKKLYIEPGSNILKIGCNYGVIENTNPPFVVEKPKPKTTKRGRPPKEKKHVRKPQGQGGYFNSQIQFEVYEPALNKVFKIKVFRPGSIQSQGIRGNDMSVIMPTLEYIAKYLEKIEGVKDVIKPVFLQSVMRNYLSYVIERKYINLSVLSVLLNEEKNKNKTIDFLCDKYIYDDDVADMLKSYNDYYDIGIAEIFDDNDQHFGLMVKFNRPIFSNPDKKITMKITQKGKINYDGANTHEEILELFEWFNYFIAKHFNLITLQDVEESSSEDHYESTYDE